MFNLKEGLPSDFAIYELKLECRKAKNLFVIIGVLVQGDFGRLYCLFRFQFAQILQKEKLLMRIVNNTI